MIWAVIGAKNNLSPTQNLGRFKWKWVARVRKWVYRQINPGAWVVMLEDDNDS